MTKEVLGAYVFSTTQQMSLSPPVIPAHLFKVLYTFKSWSPPTAVCILASEEIPTDLLFLLHNPRYGFSGRGGSVQYLLKKIRLRGCASHQIPKGVYCQGSISHFKKTKTKTNKQKPLNIWGRIIPPVVVRWGVMTENGNTGNQHRHQPLKYWDDLWRIKCSAI